MKYLSVCSGVEAASLAWEPLKWEPVAFAEVEKFPSAVLAHRWPDVPNLGDMTAWRSWPAELLLEADILVGGTPCQAFSVAGLRGSLSDERGNLALEYVKLANAIDHLRLADGRPPVVCVWENVPGILNTPDNALGCFLGALAGCGAPLVPARGQRWERACLVDGPERRVVLRTLNAVYFGVPQRRRRVFVIAHGRALGWASAEALLPLGESLQGDPAARPGSRKGASALTATGVGTCGPDDNQAQAGHLVAEGKPAAEVGPVAAAFHAHTGSDPAKCTLKYSDKHTPPLRAGAMDIGLLVNETAPCLTAREGKGADSDATTTLLVSMEPIPFDTTQITSGENRSNPQPGDPCHTIPICTATEAPAIAFENRQDPISSEEVTPPLLKSGNGGGVCCTNKAVRRLQPVECERLQGMPDDHTLVPRANGKMTSDTHRYKACGNSMAVPVMAWIGRRLQEALT